MTEEIDANEGNQEGDKESDAAGSSWDHSGSEDEGGTKKLKVTKEKDKKVKKRDKSEKKAYSSKDVVEINLTVST